MEASSRRRRKRGKIARRRSRATMYPGMRPEDPIVERWTNGEVCVLLLQRGTGRQGMQVSALTCLQRRLLKRTIRFTTFWAGARLANCPTGSFADKVYLRLRLPSAALGCIVYSFREKLCMIRRSVLGIILIESFLDIIFFPKG